MSKLSDWYDSLPEHTKEYLKRQPVWNDRDLYKAAVIGAVIGFVVGIIVGYEWAWRPVIQTFKPLIG